MKFSLSDHCLINAATEISVSRVSDKHHRAAMEDAMATFKDVLPEVTRENQMIGDLAQACDGLLEHYHPNHNSAGLTRAQFDLAQALGNIHRWKHAGSMAARQQQRGKTT